MTERIITMLLANDAGYQQQLLEEEEMGRRESFFNSVVDYGFSHSKCQFRFCLPGHNDTDDYRQQILGFFKNEPCLYNHQIFGYSASFFDVMKHPYETFQSGPAANLLRPEANLTSRSKVRTGRRHSSTTSGLDDKNPRLPDIEFGSEKEKRLTYQLVFQTLKCEII